MTENQRAAPTSTSARAASGGRRAKKMGGQKIAVGKKSKPKKKPKQVQLPFEGGSEHSI